MRVRRTQTLYRFFSFLIISPRPRTMARLISSIVSQRLLFCRTFATEAPDTLAKLRLSFVTPYQVPDLPMQLV